MHQRFNTFRKFGLKCKQKLSADHSWLKYCLENIIDNKNKLKSSHKESLHECEEQTRILTRKQSFDPQPTLMKLLAQTSWIIAYGYGLISRFVGNRYMMCILFIKFLKAPKSSEFKLILASNRDEFFKRPARTAHFWEEDSNIFGGRDMTEGKEGGTWLAMSKKGKLGVLLNVCGDNGNPEKRGRGFLIADYLKNSLSNKDYLERIKETAHEYNKFHLLTASLGKEPNLLYFSNGKECEVTEIQSEVFAISNSSVESPFQKVKKGKSRFEEICKKFGHTDKKEELIKELLSFLKWDQKHYPDEVIDSISTLPVLNRPFLSSVFVNAPEIYYGTRTHTIILVDWKDNAEFHEWSLEEPITPEHMQWRETHKNFQIKTN